MTWRRWTARGCGAALLLAGSASLRAEGGDGTEANLALNRAVYQSSAANVDNVGHLATDGSRDTFWKSAPGAAQWVYVDLGRPCPIDRVRLYWAGKAPQAFRIELSDEAATPVAWKEAGGTLADADGAAEAAFPRQEARYVRMSAQRGGETEGYALAEFQVFGPGSVATAPPATPAALSPGKEGAFSLDGLDWKVQNAAFVGDKPEEIAAPGFDDRSWIPALVPGTILASYLKAGAIPDPRYGDQQTEVSEDFFNKHDFWYRAEFATPEACRSGKASLHFDGINWKADIFLNGVQIGGSEGTFLRTSLDVTGRLRTDRPNVLAVRVHPPAHPGPADHKSLHAPTRNGGVLGLDSPTFVSSMGWNWLPSIRGRNAGIWNHVSLRATGDVELGDPFVRTDLAADLGHADLTIRAALTNRSSEARTAILRGELDNLRFSQEVPLQAGETKEVVLDPKGHPELSLDHPRVWWPNGYGEQPLYRLRLEGAVGNTVSDRREVPFGVRTLSYDTTGNRLAILVNGHRILCDGGNWGMDEGMLQYGASDYDAAVRLHKEMNLVMIRNWVGMIGRDEFYDACDKYGLLVWNDFWLANPSDGPDPSDHELFIRTMRDKVVQIRNHPSLALYCGRNEGKPPADLDAAMSQATGELDGTRYYIPDSADGLVTGRGPYEPKRPAWYFQNKGKSFHSELGIVCVPSVETMRLMMPEKDLWPIGDMWGLHDFHQPRCRDYVSLINQVYGPATGIDDFCAKAQMVNMETSKAMLETWRSRRGAGGLIWMSHPAWPSLICQLYDYYLAPTAAYFGVKKAGEPLHILWNSFTGNVEAANDTLRDCPGLTAEAAVYNMDGSLASSQSAPVGVNAGAAAVCFPLDLSKAASPVRFVRLKLSRGGEPLSDNFYWTAANDDDTPLSAMERVQVAGEARRKAGGEPGLSVTVRNPGSRVALMICLNVIRDDGAATRILPAYYQDNYFSLLPHEEKTVDVAFEPGALDGVKPRVLVKGWNVEPGVLGAAAP